MRVLARPTAPGAAAWEGWAVRRDWQRGHEFVGYRLAEDEPCSSPWSTSACGSTFPAKWRVPWCRSTWSRRATG